MSSQTIFRCVMLKLSLHVFLQIKRWDDCNNAILNPSQAKYTPVHLPYRPVAASSEKLVFSLKLILLQVLTELKL